MSKLTGYKIVKAGFDGPNVMIMLEAQPGLELKKMMFYGPHTEEQILSRIRNELIMDQATEDVEVILKSLIGQTIEPE